MQTGLDLGKRQVSVWGLKGGVKGQVGLWGVLVVVVVAVSQYARKSGWDLRQEDGQTSWLSQLPPETAHKQVGRNPNSNSLVMQSQSYRQVKLLAKINS